MRVLYAILFGCFISNPAVGVTVSQGDTPLITAVKSDDEEAVQRILQRGAPVDQTNIWYMTPLHVAAESGYERIVDLLIRYQADVNAPDSAYGWTPLHWAARFGKTEVVKCLLANHDVVVNAPDMNKQFPLHLAANYGHIDALRDLIAARADVNLTDVCGEPPLNLAVQAGHKDVVCVLLEQLGILVNLVDKTRGVTSLHWAVFYGDIDVVQALITAGADVNKADFAGVLPIDIAVQEEDEEIVALLRRAHSG
ncbi:MAG: ankyrin repeat domain-containing protein [Deltaproteobacteria bacterium]|nr:ankyrin repeat domain-containing protein [Deltaproteobacteria bacterium]